MARTTRSITLVAATLAALALAACGGGDDSTGPAPTPTPTQAKLVVKNASTLSIVTVRFSDCNDESWGPDRLNENESIAPGAERAWQITPGCYDVRAEASSGADVSWYDRQLAAGETRTLTAGQMSVGAAMSARKR